MLALKISELKTFTGKLFLKEDFHSLLLVEASFTTSVTHTIDGTLQKDFFDTDDCPSRTYCLWKDVQPICYAIIKGKRTPLQFKIVFQLAREQIAGILAQSGLSCQPEDIFGLFLNCQFDGQQLLCTTGTSLRIFSLDKSLDQLWDAMVCRFFDRCGISYEIL